MAIYSDSDYGSIIQIKNYFLCSFAHYEHHQCILCTRQRPGDFLFKVTGGGSDTKVLPRAVQQLNMLKSLHFILAMSGTSIEFIPL